MREEIKTILDKTVRIAVVVCVAAGTVALAASSAALKAMLEGARCLKETVKKILSGEPASEKISQTQVRCRKPAVVAFLSETEYSGELVISRTE